MSHAGPCFFWRDATPQDSSFPASPEEYRKACEDAGFRVVAETNKREFAVGFFDKVFAMRKGL